MVDDIKYEYKEVKIAGSLTNKGRKTALDKKEKSMAKNGWELDSYIDGGITKTSKAIFKRNINYEKPKKKSVGWIITKWIFGAFAILWFIVYINYEPLVPEEKAQTQLEKKQHIIEKYQQKEQIEENKQNLTIKSIDTNDGFTLNNKQAVSIYLKQDDYNYILLTLEKGIIKAGYTYDSSKDKDSKPPISIQAFMKPQRYYRFYGTNNTLKIKVNEYNIDNKTATITIDTVLNNTDNRDDVMDLQNIKFTISDKMFEMLMFSAKDANRDYKPSREYAAKILTTISTDISKHENHFNNFQKLTKSGSTLEVFEKAKLFEHYAKKWSIQKYVDSEIFGAKEDKAIIELINTTSELAVAYQLYYESVMNYLDNQIPSKLLKIKENIQTINYYKINVISKSTAISRKYSLEFSKTKNIWINSKK